MTREPLCSAAMELPCAARTCNEDVRYVTVRLTWFRLRWPDGWTFYILWTYWLGCLEAILEAALSWLWDLQEAFGKAYVNISEQTLSSAQKAASSASCKVPLLLRHTAANGVSVSAYIASSKSLTERWATATTRQRHFLNMLREELADVDDLVLCQLRNAWLELGRNATRERTQRKYIYAEPPKTQRSLQAATCAYWEQRAKNGLKNGLAKASAVQGFLAEVEDIQLLGKVWLLEVSWSQNPPEKEVISKLLNPDVCRNFHLRRPKQSQESPSFSPGSACQLCGKPMVVDSTLQLGLEMLMHQGNLHVSETSFCHSEIELIVVM